MTNPNKAIIGMIDHTLLKPTATPEQIQTLCEEAVQYGFASVCVNSVHVPQAAKLLATTPDCAVKVCTVVGFPLGASLPKVKAYEAELAIQQGATEIDMVINIGALKAGDLRTLHHDIATVVTTCHNYPDIICKVIIETSMLTDDEKRTACEVAKAAQADFVKTSTGFGGGGATPEDVRLMRETVGAEVGVKASGGVRSLDDAVAVVEAGATRIGASAGVAIAKDILGEGASSANGDDY